MPMRKQVLGLLFGILIITSVIIISMPIASGDQESKSDEVEILPLDTYKLEIDISKGEVEYQWEIINFTNEDIHFWLMDDDGKDIDTQTGNISEYKNKTKLKSGKYTFNWYNKKSQGNITLFYDINFTVTGEGCYSTDIILSVSLITIIFFSIGINKKKK
jgi:hypothetical protein